MHHVFFIVFVFVVLIALQKRKEKKVKRIKDCDSFFFFEGYSIRTKEVKNDGYL